MMNVSEYLVKPPSGGMVAASKTKGTQRWLDDEGREWEPVRVEKRMLWRVKESR